MPRPQRAAAGAARKGIEEEYREASERAWAEFQRSRGAPAEKPRDTRVDRTDKDDDDDDDDSGDSDYDPENDNGSDLDDFVVGSDAENEAASEDELDRVLKRAGGERVHRAKRRRRNRTPSESSESSSESEDESSSEGSESSASSAGSKDSKGSGDPVDPADPAAAADEVVREASNDH